MRLIDANALHVEISKWPESVMYKDWVQSAIATAPTLTPQSEWISVKNELPKLPDKDWCSIMVIAAQKGNPKSHPMIYERAVVRGKRVERWKYCWDKIADELPDYWMPLPKPPKEELKDGKDD